MKIIETRKGRRIRSEIGFFPITVYLDYKEMIALLSPDTNMVGLIWDKREFFYPVSKGSDPRVEDYVNLNLSYRNGVYTLDEIPYRREMVLSKKGIYKKRDLIDMSYIQSYKDIADKFDTLGVKTPVRDIALEIISYCFFSRDIYIKVTTPIRRAIGFEGLYSRIQNKMILHGSDLMVNDFLSLTEMIELLTNPTLSIVNTIENNIKKTMV